jgi:hypothetical protein
VVGLKRFPPDRTCVNRKVVAQFSWALIPVSKQGKKEVPKMYKQNRTESKQNLQRKIKFHEFPRQGQTIKFAAKKKP